MGVLLQLAVVLLTLAAVVYLWCRKRYRYFLERGVPYLEPIYLVGNTWKALLGMEQIGEVHKIMYKELKKKGAKIGGIFQATTPVYIVMDPEMVHRVMIKDFSHFVDRGIKVDEEVNPLEGHLFMLSGERWRTMRIKLTPTFTSGKLKWMYEQMEVCGNMLLNMVEDLRKDGEIEIKDMLARFTTDVIGSCVFGLEPESIKDPESKFRVYGRKIFLPDMYDILVGAFRFAFPEVFLKLKMRTVPKEIHNFFTSVMKQTMDYRKKNGYIRNDFVQLLLQLKEKGTIEVDPRDNMDEFMEEYKTSLGDEKIELTDNLLTAQAFVFFVAGFETSATSMSWALYLLAKHPEAQEKARKEIREAKKKHGGFTYDALKELHYLENCFNEALRMYAPIPVQFRECTKTITFDDGLTIEKGTMLNIPTCAIHMDPEIFPNPEEFRPERFEEGQGSQPGAFTPFGGGPRICIGKRFAMVEVKMGMAMLLDNYKVSPGKRLKEPVQLHERAFITMAKDGLWLNFDKAQD